MVIKVSHLTKSFSSYRKEVGLKYSIKNLFHREQIVKEAVKQISFEVDEGEIVGFLGPNGAGKTTTLKILAGIMYPTTGTATVLGYVPWERKKDFKKQFSIVMGQKGQLWWDLPANESLLLSKYIYEMDDRDYKKSLAELSELLSVKELLGVQVRRLSLGERMKMELIASLIFRPKVILMDEPTIGLDFISQKKIREFIKYYNQETKATVILTSHYMNDIEDLCKRSIIIDDGKIIYDEELKKLNGLLSQKKIVKILFSKAVDKDDVGKFGVIRKFDGLSTTIELDRQSFKEYSQILLDTLPIMDFNIEDIPIEEGITFLYQKGGEHGEIHSQVC